MGASFVGRADLEPDKAFWGGGRLDTSEGSELQILAGGHPLPSTSLVFSFRGYRDDSLYVPRKGLTLKVLNECSRSLLLVLGLGDW